jgi:hypothetical protein
VAKANAQEGIPKETAAEVISELSREALWKLQSADPEDVAYTAKSALPWWEQKLVNFKLNQNPGAVGAIIEQIRVMQEIARAQLAPQKKIQQREQITLRIA